MKKNIINYGGTLLGIFAYVGFRELYIDLGFTDLGAILTSLLTVFLIAGLVIFISNYFSKKGDND